MSVENCIDDAPQDFSSLLITQTIVSDVLWIMCGRKRAADKDPQLLTRLCPNEQIASLHEYIIVLEPDQVGWYQVLMMQTSTNLLPSEPSKSNKMPATVLGKPIIIGLYGISGSGKTILLLQMRIDPTLDNFLFYDGSQLLGQVTPGGLDAFRKLKPTDKVHYREQALEYVSHACKSQQKTAVIAGHYIFWNPEKTPKYLYAGVNKDWETYTHIIYLNTDPELVADRRSSDISRRRQSLHVDELREWQQMERNELRDKCREHGVFFTSINETALSPQGATSRKVKTVLKAFHEYTEEVNLEAVESALTTALGNLDKVEKVLVFDADKTLAPQDTGALFWECFKDCTDFAQDPLKKIFQDGQYSYAQFRQAMLYYEEVADMFDEVCEKVAGKVKLYPGMVELLTRAAKESRAHTLVVTCGRAEIWKQVLDRYGLSHVKVIGSGRFEYDYVVTGAIKGEIVDKIHEMKLRVIAFGDSPLDIDMLKRADRALVVVGESEARSKSMDAKLDEAITAGLKAQQILLPNFVKPRLDLERLPQCALANKDLDIIFRQPFLHATDKNIAKLLQTPTRDARNTGHELRKAHENIGYYLAMEYLSSLLGVEEYEIPHVQGNTTQGYRFKNEAETLIVPLMRGGEPMALGVSKALKTAAFAHAYNFADFEPGGKVAGNIEGKKTIILVDSVINSGRSIVEFVEPLRRKYKNVRVVVVAGVVQAGATVGTELARMLETDGNLTLVALRKSENKFTGKGGTDTGHRLFNTTYLD